MKISLNWIDRYNEFKDDSKFIERQSDLRCVEMKDGKPKYKKDAADKEKSCKSYQVVQRMMQNGMFTKIESLNKYNYADNKNDEIGVPKGL